MRWEDERYVRVYVRDTVRWHRWPWETRALLLFLFRKVDRAGIIEVGDDGLEGLALLVGMPPDVVEKAIAPLLSSGTVALEEGTLLIPNFIEAQETVYSDAARQRESRERRRDLIRRGLHPGQRTAVVYFVQSAEGGPIKIGHAEDVAKRLIQLQTSRPDKLVILAAVAGTVDQERALHKRFASIRQKGEWFHPDPSLLDLIGHVRRDGSLPGDLSQYVTSHPVPIRSEPVLANPPGGADRARVGRAYEPGKVDVELDAWVQAVERESGRPVDQKARGHFTDFAAALTTHARDVPREEIVQWVTERAVRFVRCGRAQHFYAELTTDKFRRWLRSGEPDEKGQQHEPRTAPMKVKEYEPPWINETRASDEEQAAAAAATLAVLSGGSGA